MICPICKEYKEDGCHNPDCVEQMSIRGYMGKVRRINRSANTGKFVDNQTAKDNPSETVCETISPAADIIRHVREALPDMPEAWREVFSRDLQRIEND